VTYNITFLNLKFISKRISIFLLTTDTAKILGLTTFYSAVSFYKCKKLTSLKLIVRTMWWYHSTKTAKIFWV